MGPMTLQTATNMAIGPNIRKNWRAARSRSLFRYAAQYSSSTATLYARPGEGHLADLPESGGACQSSSGRKMWGATHALQIGVAASRSPRGIGTFRSG
jgi:hypothetical protein